MYGGKVQLHKAKTQWPTSTFLRKGTLIQNDNIIKILKYLDEHGSGS